MNSNSNGVSPNEPQVFYQSSLLEICLSVINILCVILLLLNTFLDSAQILMKDHVLSLFQK